MSTSTCESCRMPTANGPYCQLCVDENGKLQPFDKCFERILAWQARHQPKAPREQIERNALAYMAAMPAWEVHPRIKAAFPKP